MTEDGEQLVPMRLDQDRLEEIGLGDPSFTRDLINIMITDSRARVDLIRNCCTSGDWNRVSREAHSLKGAALNIGAPELAKKSARLDTAAQDGRMAETLVEDVASELKAVTKELIRYMNSLPR